MLTLDQIKLVEKILSGENPKENLTNLKESYIKSLYVSEGYEMYLESGVKSTTKIKI